MPSFLTKTVASFFNRICQVDQSGNSGVDSTIRSMQTGDGVNTAISFSTNHLDVQPQASNSTTTLKVKNYGGDALLTVDSTNSRVLCGSSQINALTQYQRFIAHDLDPSGSGVHTVIPLSIGAYGSYTSEWDLGSDANPATTLDVSASGDTNNIVPCLWYLPDAITVMSASVLMGGDAATDSTLNFHLMSYAIDTSSNFGDLSDGTVVIDSGEISEVDETVIKITTMNGTPADVASGRVILATVESDQNLYKYSVQIIVKYHIQ